MTEILNFPPAKEVPDYDLENDGVVIDMPAPKVLTLEQKLHWEKVLEDSERAVEVARRMLGILAVELGLEG